MEVSYEDKSVYIDDLNLSLIEVEVNNDNELFSGLSNGPKLFYSLRIPHCTRIARCCRLYYIKNSWEEMWLT